MNANDSVKEEKEIDCIGMAFAADKEAKLSYEQFSAVVDACESAQN